MSDTDATRAAFLSAIAANPFDATPRLIFADWLEERGEQEPAEQLRRGMIPLSEQDRAAVAGMARLRMYGRDGKFIQSMRDKATCRTCEGKGTILSTWRPKKGLISCPHCSGKTFSALTPRQLCWLHILTHRYRRQMKDEAVKAEAERRYERYCEMMDIHTKPLAERHTTRKTQMEPMLWD